MSCYYQPSEQHLLAFDDDRPLAADEVHEFAPGSSLTFRCADIGKYALIGSASRTCEYGEWTGVKSSCIGLSQEHDYARKLMGRLLLLKGSLYNYTYTIYGINGLKL